MFVVSIRKRLEALHPVQIGHETAKAIASLTILIVPFSGSASMLNVPYYACFPVHTYKEARQYEGAYPDKIRLVRQSPGTMCHCPYVTN